MAGTPTWWEGFVRDVLKRWPNTELDQLEGMPALLVNGNPFAALSSFDILVRLDDFTRNRALAKPMAREFDPADDPSLPRGWVLLTVPSSAAERFSEEWSRPAYEFVAAMVPKRRPKPEEPPRPKRRRGRTRGSPNSATSPSKQTTSKRKPAKKAAKTSAKKTAKKTAKKAVKKSAAGKKKKQPAKRK